METRGRQAIRKQLEMGYRERREESLSLAKEWFPLEEEVATRMEGPVRPETIAQNPSSMMFPRRGEIYLVEFDPTRGCEVIVAPSKTNGVVVASSILLDDAAIRVVLLDHALIGAPEDYPAHIRLRAASR